MTKSQKYATILLTRSPICAYTRNPSTASLQKGVFNSIHGGFGPHGSTTTQTQSTNLGKIMAKKTTKKKEKPAAAKVVREIKPAEELFRAISQAFGVHPMPIKPADARSAGARIVNLLKSGERRTSLIDIRLRAVESNFADMPNRPDNYQPAEDAAVVSINWRNLAVQLMSGMLDRADSVGDPPEFKQIRAALIKMLPKEKKAKKTKDKPASHGAGAGTSEELVA